MAHISEAQLRDYIEHKMSIEEQMDFMEHVAECEYCAGRLAAAMQQQELIVPPPDMRASILEKTVNSPKPRVVPDSVFASILQKIVPEIKRGQIEFWGYTAKVVCAMALAIAMIMGSSFTLNGGNGMNKAHVLSDVNRQLEKNSASKNEDDTSITDAIRQSSSKVTDNISKWISFGKDNK